LAETQSTHLFRNRLSDGLIHSITLYARQPRVQAIPACNQTTSRGSTKPNGATLRRMKVEEIAEAIAKLPPDAVSCVKAN
jgi:hypothetical protein